MLQKLVTWKDFDDAARQLAAELNLSRRTYCLLGQPRGGLVLAVRLSHLLQIPLVTQPVRGRTLIWVDDILDKGTAWRKAKERYHPTLGVVWITKDITASVLFALDVSPNVWIVFPWEVA